MKKSPNTIALVYDFDGTLSPDNMQERTIFKHYGIDKDMFWNKAKNLVDEFQYERTLAYLKLLIYDPVFLTRPINPQLLKDLAEKEIRYFKGVETFFDELNYYVSEMRDAQELSVKVEHYVISSGLKELLDGCSIIKHFKKVYACEYEYQNNRPVFPKLVINDTNKTQFLFRINKGRLNLSEDINSHMPHKDRPIPFENMIYIGDGNTDIPSMTVTQRNGGHAIAVYPPGERVPDEIKCMVADGRADHFAPADYTNGTLLVKIVRTAIRKIVQNMMYKTSTQRSKSWVEHNRKV